uniref:Abhydrolase domain-containing protein 4 n=2 Tax=Pararge aegeria TaxID=116150 RepID=S4P050_9NEOP
MHGFGWAKNPMVRRVTQLDPALPITVLYGSRSWVDNSTGQLLKENRPSSKTYVQVINGAGHHVYLDKPEQFNKYVLEACVLADDSPRRVTTDKAHIPKNSNSEVIDQATAS